MSFFFGVNATTPTNSSSASPFDKTILPGHNFKDVFMTGTIAIVATTLVLLVVFWWMCRRLPVIPDVREPDQKHDDHPTSFIGTFCFYYVLYLIFELVTRICVELRLTVPYAFIAITIPTSFILMVADIIALGMVINGSAIIRKRINLNRDGFTYLGVPIWMVAILAIVAALMAERITYTVMMVGQAFRWNRPDAFYYALNRVVYTGGWLLATVLEWGGQLRIYAVYRMRLRTPEFVDRCGIMPVLMATVVGPMLVVRALSAFCFTFLFRFQQRRQNPDLELLRMGCLCVPLIVIVVCYWFMRREDYRIKHKDVEPEFQSDILRMQKIYGSGG